MAELADAPDSKSGGRKAVKVRLHFCPHAVSAMYPKPPCLHPIYPYFAYSRRPNLLIPNEARCDWRIMSPPL
jgi:hypothetical protein